MSMTTEALVLTEVGEPLEWDNNVILGPLRPDELLVDIHATGVCHTDVACMTGKLPIPLPQVLGHEGAGIVVAVGGTSGSGSGSDNDDVRDSFSPGDKVVLSYNHCGTCHQCTHQHPAYCERLWSLNFEGKRLPLLDDDDDDRSTAPLPPSMASRRRRDGKILSMGNFFGQSSFCRRAIVNERCAVKVDESADLYKLAPLGCGLQTGAGVVLNDLNIQKGDSLVVFGAGTVGMSAIMAAVKIRGASLVIAVDIQKNRRELAVRLGGAHSSIDGSDTNNIVEQIRSLVPHPPGLMNAIDTTSNPRVIEKMIECLGTRGKAVSIGSPSPGVKIEIEVFSHLNLGREYLGSTQGDSIAQQMIPYLIEQHEQGNYPFDRLITYYDAEDFQSALDDFKSGKVYKPVLKWHE